jgi:hypothetical protein
MRPASGSRRSEQQQQQQQQQQGLGLNPADQQLLDDLAMLLLPAASRQHGSKRRDQHNASSSSSSRSRSSGSGGTGGSPQHKASSGDAHYQQQQQQQQGAVLLQRLTQRWRVLWFKRCVLEHQLSFVARCSAEQTKLVSSLVQRAAAASADAAEEFDAAGGLQQRREDAGQLARQLLRALLLVEQQGGSGSAVRALAGVLQQHREALADLPQVSCLGSSQGAVVLLCVEAYGVVGWLMGSGMLDQQKVQNTAGLGGGASFMICIEGFGKGAAAALGCFRRPAAGKILGQRPTTWLCEETWGTANAFLQCMLRADCMLMQHRKQDFLHVAS